jgi:hypothetical protein
VTDEGRGARPVHRGKFRQIDVTRALRAAKAAGLPISRCEIDAEGKIVIVSDVPHMATNNKAESAFDKWDAKYGTSK